MQQNHAVVEVFLGYVNLARLRIVFMVLISCAIGFVLAYRSEFDSVKFAWTLLGTGLLSAGSCALNCFLERDHDALMERTRTRPLPSGLIAPLPALAYGLMLVGFGYLSLQINVNALSALLGLIAVFVYVAIYTPCKRLTWWNTSIGAIPGAIPPLMGWAAARGTLDAGGWILFWMLFIWQHTHFLPIAWLYKDDYGRAGFRMLPVLETDGRKTFLLTVGTAMILLPVSLLLCGHEFVGAAYYVAAMVCGALLVGAGFHMVRQPSRGSALAVLFLSLWYLPVILFAVLFDRYGVEFASHLQAWLGTVCKWT